MDKLRLMKALKNDRILIFMGVSIMLCLIVAGIFLTDHRKAGFRKSPAPEDIESYAMLFLQHGEKEKLGKRLDCSGFTREVFKKFAIHLPSSAKKQFEVSSRLDGSILRKGNLVFFRIDGSEISHVGIYLDSVSFIHSPGRKKYVRIDRLDDNYWMRTYAGGGIITHKMNK
jgi:cell wall-associated NlpC family hydrolase